MKAAKKAVSIFIATALVLSLSATALAATKTPTVAYAIPTNSSVLVNEVSKSFNAYNIGGSNYFKLRDLAYVLSGTAKQFEVSWDAINNSICLTTNKAYTSVGGEMATGNKENTNAILTTSKVYIDGSVASLAVYSINNNNYFKLRDIGQALNFGVTWDEKTSTIGIDTATIYIGNKPETNKVDIKNLPYVGDVSKCKISATQAKAYIQALKSAPQSKNQSTINHATLVDVSGDGVPLLFVWYATPNTDSSGFNWTVCGLECWEYQNGKAINLNINDNKSLEIKSWNGEKYLCSGETTDETFASEDSLLYKIKNGAVVDTHTIKRDVNYQVENSEVQNYLNQGWSIIEGFSSKDAMTLYRCLIDEKWISLGQYDDFRNDSHGTTLVGFDDYSWVGNNENESDPTYQALTKAPSTQLADMLTNILPTLK